MSPRAAGGQLDEISAKIGELGAYVHEHRHGVNNLSLKFDALSLDIAKRVEALEAKMVVRIDDMAGTMRQQFDGLAARVQVLENDRLRREGIKGALDWLLKNWLSLAAMIVVIFTVLLANGKI